MNDIGKYICLQVGNRKFEILNLKEALDLIETNKTINISTSATTMDQSMCAKYLEIIMESPVFYNLNLIPTCKYKYQSQFTKSQFSIPELRFVIDIT
jgi:hypothetical protein